jgi:hypothetical protein
LSHSSQFGRSSSTEVKPRAVRRSLARPLRSRRRSP